MPVVEAGSGSSAIAFSRFASLPARFWVASLPCTVSCTTRAIPAES
jgi:hypothetical protein